MAFTVNQGAKIYWDEVGEGDPLLLIMGLEYPSCAWHRSRPLLSKKYRTIALDNRGVGQSDVPPDPYPIALMASDTAAVLDDARVESAHVLGVSLGGMIAQEFALQYPRRVRSLILGCTAAGGPHAVRSEEATQMLTQILMSCGKMTPEEAAQAAVPFVYHPATPQRFIDEDLEVLRPSYPSHEGYAAQLLGALAWESYSRLSQINLPALVIHGESDRLVPPGNGRLIAEKIPGAKLVMLARASHIFTTDQTEEANLAILEFLESQNGTLAAPVPFA